MKSTKCILWTGLFLGCVLLSLVGCNVSDATPPSGSHPTTLPLGTSNTSDTQSAQLSPTAVPSPVSTFTPIPSPVATLTPLFTPIPTILPTLLPDEAQELILELFQNNGGCLLPCFWGFISGQTEWQTAEPFLTTFAYQIYYRAPDGTYSNSPDGTSFVAEVYLFLPQISSAPISLFYTVQNNIITMIEAHALPTSSNTLPAILGTYGQPTEVWLLTASTPIEDFLGFNVTLFYAQHNSMLTYGGQGTIHDGIVQGCFSEQAYELLLVTWLDEEGLTFSEASSRTVSLDPITFYRPLEEATGMGVDTFHETFRNSDEPVCLETPTNLWPGP